MQYLGLLHLVLALVRLLLTPRRPVFASVLSQPWAILSLVVLILECLLKPLAASLWTVFMFYFTYKALSVGYKVLMAEKELSLYCSTTLETCI